MVYKLLETEIKESHLLCKLEGEAAERHGAIGYMCISIVLEDQFRSKWYDCQSHLKSQDLKTELDAVIRSLRNDGSEPPFASMENLEVFCNRTVVSNYTIRTTGYSYYLRLTPMRERYDACIFVYDNRYLLPELGGQHELPRMCFSTLPSSGAQIWIKRGSSGYVDFIGGGTREEIRADVDKFNAKRGITKAQEAAMVSGALHGWDTPAAKPWNYDTDGTPRPLPHKKKNDPER